MVETQKFHSALAVTNVKSLIPITLDMETGQYHSWATLFKVQAKVHSVLEHIIPPTDDEAKKKYQASKDADLPLWNQKAWQCVADLFQDNKNTRAVYLETQFTNTSLADFSSTSAYCNQLKSLADQLSNVGAPISNQRPLLRLLAGLTEAYSGFVTVMQQKDHLPTFATLCSRLKLEETTIKDMAACDSSSTSFLSVDNDSSSQPP
ncbi:uncharacterized protein LOC133795113 [Humulus lupulus]|uniref:uncharacterized protein LOC133795113 n=1 Tax=Humulus lupulus TaxID=3486 RepID=UPI002B40149C|nr:uncharacterized protein LOC133795113 [Humulus lupulus]